MTINKYRAKSLKAAIDKARADLGPEAKVLHVKQLASSTVQAFEKGLSEPVGGQVVEIIAAIDDDIDQTFEENLSKREKTGASANVQAFEKDLNERIPEASAPKTEPTRNTQQNVQKDMSFSHMPLKQKLERAGTSYSLHKDMLTRDGESSPTGTVDEEQTGQKLHQSFGKGLSKRENTGSSAPAKAFENGMSKRASGTSVPGNDSSPGKCGTARSAGKTWHKSAVRKQQMLRDNRSILQKLHQCCSKNQVNDNITYEILSLLRDDQQPIPDKPQSSFLIGHCSDPVTPRDYLSLFMSRQINMSGGLDMSQRTTIFIGPTGVGKTTTLAKLAAQYHFQQEKAVGLISIDAYRIAAIDQLKTYAQIMSVPLRVALTPEELDRCIHEYGDMDLILVDTPGRSQFDADALGALGEFLEAAQPADTHLLIALSTKEEDAYAVAENFAPQFVRQVIFTKLDETSSFGSVLNIPVMIDKPVSYLTTGQNVPDDIEVAQVERIANLFLRS